MTLELTKGIQLEVFSKCTLQKTSIHIQQDISKEDYLKIGEALHLIQGSVQFWIGDWLRFGEKKWGEMYKEAQEVTGLDNSTLRHAKSISENVPLLSRNNNLSFNHHAVVAPLAPDEQQKWLSKAETEGLSYRDLKEEIKNTTHREALEAAQNSIDAQKRANLKAICDLRVMSCIELFESGIKPDAVITDPPYPHEFIDCFSELAEASQEVPLVAVMSGHMYLPEVMQRLCSFLDYRWTMAYLTPGAASQQFPTKIISNWKPILLFGKADQWSVDVFHSQSQDKLHHEWGQSESGLMDLIEKLTKPGDLICDPFLGGGATAIAALKLGRRFVGCDIDPECVKISQTRIEAWAWQSDQNEQAAAI